MQIPPPARVHDRNHPRTPVDRSQNILGNALQCRLVFCKVRLVGRELFDEVADPRPEFLFLVGYLTA